MGTAKPRVCLIERKGIVLPQFMQNALLLSPGFGMHWLLTLQLVHCRPLILLSPLVAVVEESTTWMWSLRRRLLRFAASTSMSMSMLVC
jgi:hypothetical protein